MVDDNNKESADATRWCVSMKELNRTFFWKI